MKVGDYVRINEGVHDEKMPKERRDGMIVEVVGNNDQAYVMFNNNVFLKFHKSQLTILVKV